RRNGLPTALPSFLHDALPISQQVSLDFAPAALVLKGHGWPVRRCPAVAPCRQSQHHRLQIAPLVRRNVFLLVGVLRMHALLHERSEEHTSELQSLAYLVCRLL